jgi:hypothetical protein
MILAKCIRLAFLLDNAEPLMHENVFFHKIGDFSMSRSKWLVSFVIDLNKYENFLDKLSFDINNAENLTNLIIIKYGVPIDTSPYVSYEGIFKGLKNEIGVVRSMHKDVVASFMIINFCVNLMDTAEINMQSLVL